MASNPFDLSGLFTPALMPSWAPTGAQSLYAWFGSLQQNAQALLPFSRPSFALDTVKFRGETIAVHEQIEKRLAFCILSHFLREAENEGVTQRLKDDPKVLIIPPFSGHSAPMLRGTIEGLLPSHDVHLVAWTDAKAVPLTQGFFDLEDQTTCLASFYKTLGPDLHVIAVGQAAVPALAAVALLSEHDSREAPRSLTLIGGTIDAREARPSPFSLLAAEKSLSWFRATFIDIAPPYVPGAWRRLYRGEQGLWDSGLESASQTFAPATEIYRALWRGDEDPPATRRRFHAAFFLPQDVPEELFLQTVERVYQIHALAQGAFYVHAQRVDLASITNTALLTIEGERDDLFPAGVTRAALALCPNVPSDKKQAHLEIGSGHLSVLNGRPWRASILPVIHKFIRAHAAA